MSWVREKREPLLNYGFFGGTKKGKFWMSGREQPKGILMHGPDGLGFVS
jgi:hypothetical protein